MTFTLTHIYIKTFSLFIQRCGVAGYSSLGDVVCPESHNPDQVCADAAANTSCVHFTATEPCRYGEKIHECANANNGGYDMSAWEIIADGPVDVIDGYFG